MKNHSRILVAVDTPDIDNIYNLLEQVKPYVGGIKLGLEFFNHHGVNGVNKIMSNIDSLLFLDLKFHDIPNTVAGAIRGAMQCRPNILNIHISGGLEMMKRAKEEVVNISNSLGIEQPLLIGVTILTALNDDDLKIIGYNYPLQEQVVRMVMLAQEAGLDGVVCSAFEIEIIRKYCKKDFKLIVPGIRPLGCLKGDQKRVMTPLEALNLGADYIVIGRPITDAKNVDIAAKNIADSID